MRGPRTSHALFVTFALMAALGSVAAAQPATQPPPPFVVIVNPNNRIATVSRSFVADAYMKKITRWGDNELVRPVDLAGASALRRQFARDVVRRSLEALRSYWQQLIFSGRGLPPVEVRTEDDVVTYVLRHRGAIGYVSGTTRLRGARVVTVR